MSSTRSPSFRTSGPSIVAVPYSSVYDTAAAGRGELSSLADRQDSDSRHRGDGTREEEATGLEPADDIELTCERLDERLGDGPHRRTIGEQRGDVAEDNSRFGIVRN